MRRTLSALLLSAAAIAPAAAADLPARMPVKAPVLVESGYNWTGLYVGGHVGGVWSKDTGTNLTANPAQAAGAVTDSDYSGFLGGGQVGVNFQSGRFVFGIEGDWSWTNEDGSTTNPSLIPGTSLRGTADTRWYATLAGRLGIANNNWLFYVKGGAAWKDVRYTADVLTGGLVVASASVSDTRSGWLVGGGIEWGIAANWSAKIEYNYLDFGSDTLQFVTPLGGSSVDVESKSHVIKAGLNYRFNWASPVVARY